MQNLGLPNVEESADLDNWLEQVGTQLVKLGYRKYKQNFKGEEFAYWKSFNDRKYQVGLLFFDFRKYSNFPSAYYVSVQYYCMLNYDGRTDLTVSDDITLAQFEAMSAVFYETMSKFVKQ